MPDRSRRTVTPSGRTQPRFAGVSTFGRYPRLDDVTPDNRPIDWLVFGAPFDNGVTYRNGARFGPRAIRDESQYLKSYHLEHDVAVTDRLSIADAGDASVAPFSCEANADAVAAFAESLDGGGASHDTKLLMLGGDHSNTLPALRAAHARNGKLTGGLALVHFDSHLDTVDTVWGERYCHASPFIRAIEEGVVNPRKMISIGIKGPLNTPEDLRFAQEHGVEVVTYGRFMREGVAPITAFLDRLGDEPAYCTFDIDCIDPVYAPGTGTPSVGGFTSAQALDLLRLMARNGDPVNLVGADVVEVLPDRDVAGNTALLAAHLAFEMLSVAALRVAR
jgi:agmatinase